LAPVEPPMIQFTSLENGKKDPEFQKEYLKLIGERMKWKLVRELP
jgi:hypothetical protein